MVVADVLREMSGLLLRRLELADEASFRRAVEAMEADVPPWQLAFHFDPDADFSSYLRTLDGWARGEGLLGDFVPNSFLVGVVDDTIVGRVSIRHRLNSGLARIGGHIGYGVIPSQRKKGYATAMLQQALPLCAQLGLKRVLITCDEDNIGSRNVIERCGGVYENSVAGSDLAIPKRRYWIELP